MLKKYIYLCVCNRVGIEIPKIEVRFEDLCIDGDAYVGSRALPTLWNASINFVEVLFHFNNAFVSFSFVVLFKRLNSFVFPSSNFIGVS